MRQGIFVATFGLALAATAICASATQPSGVAQPAPPGTASPIPTGTLSPAPLPTQTSM